MGFPFSIYMTEELYARMQIMNGLVNWSQVARTAFSKAIKEQTKHHEETKN